MDSVATAIHDKHLTAEQKESIVNNIKDIENNVSTLTLV